MLAARLAEDPKVSVCLVEAGGNGRSPFITMPAGNGFIFGNPNFDWMLESTPQEGLGNRRIYYPRGKGIGGSSLLNGMIYIRGNSRDFDHWHQLGLEGWSYEDVLPYFKRAEGAPHRGKHYHGHNGPLKLTPAANYDTLSKIFVDATQQAGAKYNPDFNGEFQSGVGRYDVTVVRGKRQSAAAAYLSHLPTNLEILTGAHVVNVKLSKDRAIGIEILSNGASQILYAEREVISCLGAFGSPQLLMLSGIGPAEHLRTVGIKPHIDRPGVGNSLQDHPVMPVQYKLLDASLSLARFQRIDRAIGLGLQYLLTHDGPGAAPFWSTALFHLLTDTDFPELQVNFTPMVVKEEAASMGWSIQNFMNLGSTLLARGKMAIPGVQFDINLLHPKSQGQLRLASANPTASPLIDPSYFTEPVDLAKLVAGVRHIRDVANQSAFRGALGEEVSPSAECQTKSEIATAIRREVTTGHHPVSTCRMGPKSDPNAVIGANFKVRGTENLRVVDASAFPTQISGNVNAAIIMMAERAADFILGNSDLSGKKDI